MTLADDYGPEREGDAERDDTHVCGLCGMRYATPPNTACSTCA